MNTSLNEPIVLSPEDHISAKHASIDRFVSGELDLGALPCSLSVVAASEQRGYSFLTRSSDTDVDVCGTILRLDRRCLGGATARCIIQDCLQAFG